ncbi:Glycosyltransferase Family 1 protein [Trametes cinnabarina]|uniref:sterol 3beta-glucosyltransferase n=1 Tax=Pycnoporus cinnabarinus TaxID=5643 RepID=A0A060SCX3_PYCCI|nr:Glycosyltransferase Family 1 protein [Trametes cinnabarina]
MAHTPSTGSPPPTPGSPPTTATSPVAESKHTHTASKGSILQRALEKTRNAPLLSQSQPALPQPSHKRMFSLTRGKGKDRQTNEEHPPTSQSQVLPSPHRAPSKERRRHAAGGDDDSPFITPSSPSLHASRPERPLGFGFQSLHAGTQTFIQALQAVPWAEDQDNDDEFLNHDSTPLSAESDDEDQHVNRLTSSIHAIYRPVARSRRVDTHVSAHALAGTQPLPTVADTDESGVSDEPAISDEDMEGDFETHSPGHVIDARHTGRSSPEPIPGLDTSASDIPDLYRTRERVTSRSGNMSTVRQNRRPQLAEKLRDIFELKDINEVVAEMPCWLLRSVLLQGYMYLTDAYICFFAHLPTKEDQVLKSGSLMKKAQRTKRWIRHWFVLKNDVLSWYQSPADPYFPHGVVDLRYAISCEPVNEKDIRLRTNQKSIRLSADSGKSRDEWIKAIRKVMLKATNMGDSIKIAIPYPAVVDVERSNAMDFSETIEIKVQDRSSDLALDSYFFAYFTDLSIALEQIRDAVRTYRAEPSFQHAPTVVDTTSARSPVAKTGEHPPITPIAGHRPNSPPGFKLTSFLRPLQETLPIVRSASAPGPATDEAKSEEFTHISKRAGSSFVPVATTVEATSPTAGEPPGRPDLLRASTSSLTPTPSVADHTYPPSVSGSSADMRASPSPSTATPAHSNSWSVGMPSWLRLPSRSLFGVSSVPGVRPIVEHASTLPAVHAMPAVTELVSSRASTASRPTTIGSGSGEFGFFSILETPDTMVDSQTIDKFRQEFAFDDKEHLLGMFSGYLYRLLPVYGRLYVSNNYLCFKSSGPLTMRTRMILPLKDILATEKQKSFHFGHHGLVVIVRGHEELFLEFADEDRRDAFASVVQRQLEDVQERTTSGESRSSSDTRPEALILEEFGPRNPLNLSDSQTSSRESAAAHMFTSQSSTFLSFKPDRPLHFTFLTIGSRGDVQPYIALAKGLMADGHRVRIATHGEFKEWVESHGIEFGYVGGDPAELMRICVENGTFTFRGWIDDLLKTSWEACQGTDVLIESPSAMGGYHIAEALKIPYFRAFTMTWSRTRAYPHAFAVPEHKMGGNYNYMTYVLFDQVFWRGTAGQINRWRKNTLGLPSTSLDRMEPHKIPFLYNFSPVVVPPPLDWPEWIRVTGYWFLDDADVGSKKWEAPQDLLDFMAEARKAKKKIVYIGFGSIVVPDPKAMTRCVIDAIVESGVYAIMSKGWSDRLVKNKPAETEPEEPLPKQIYPISSIPHDWLFKQIDAACHHGGAGTTGASLRAGIPTIIKPFFGDQFFWADRVEALGVGAAVRKLTVDSLAQALREATTNEKQIERARAVGQRIRAENGVATAIEAIYRDMEYARSLIKGAAHRNIHEQLFDAEHATIRDYSSTAPLEQSSPSGSIAGPASDWSVISDSDEPLHDSCEP